MEKFLIKLQDIYKRYLELSEKLSDADVIADTALWTKIAKDQSEIAEVSQMYEEYLSVMDRLKKADEGIRDETDPEMRGLFLAEIEECSSLAEKLKGDLKVALLPKDKNDDRNCIVEIRGGAGGDEAALFAYELYRMYLNYCERHRLKARRDIRKRRSPRAESSRNGVAGAHSYFYGDGRRSPRSGGR